MKLINIRKDEKETNDYIVTVEHKYLLFKHQVEYYGNRMFVMIGSEKHFIDGYVWILLPYGKPVLDKIQKELDKWVREFIQNSKGGKS